MDINDFIHELDLFSKEELEGNEELEVLKKYGTIAAITDVVILTGGHYSKRQTHRAPDDSSLKGRTSWFYTSSPSKNGVRVCMNGSVSFRADYENAIGAIRPVLRVSPSLFAKLSLNKVKGYNGVEEVEYGEYPQYVPNSDMQRTLEDEFQKGNLQVTGRNYTFNKLNWMETKQLSFKPIEYKEYEYHEKRYIRMLAKPYKKTFKLSNNIRYHKDNNIWVEVLPVVWLVDEKTEKLVSKKGLLSGIKSIDPEKEYPECPDLIYHLTEIKNFLDKYMINDLFQNNELIYEQTHKKKSLEKNDEEVIGLVRKIKEYMKYYHGDIDVAKRVNDLIQNYNQKLEDLAKISKTSEIKLSLESNNVDILHKKLILELDNIISELKSYSANIKSHYDMIDILKECKQGINNKDNELSIIIYNIKTIILKFIYDDKVRNDLDTKLDQIIDENIKKNMECIRNFENLNVKSEHTKTIQELKLEFRKAIHPYLIKLNDAVLKQDVANEVMDNIKLMMSNNYTESKNKQIKYFSNIIYTILDEIRKNGNDEDLAKMNELLTFEIDYNKDIIEILKDLNKIIIKAYKLNFGIMKHNSLKKDIDKRKIMININEFLQEEQNNVYEKRR